MTLTQKIAALVKKQTAHIADMAKNGYVVPVVSASGKLQGYDHAQVLLLHLDLESNWEENPSIEDLKIAYYALKAAAMTSLFTDGDNPKTQALKEVEQHAFTLLCKTLETRNAEKEANKDVASVTADTVSDKELVTATS